jgi:cytochrome c biogenesis protein CcmG/thiol:disulfide interchange protein DsbE
VAETRPSPLRFALPIVLLFALVGVLALMLWRINAGKYDIHEIHSPLIGKRAPLFELPALANPTLTVRNTTYAGRMYVLNVWGTWCPECRVEHGTLLAIAKETSVPIIGLDWKEEDRIAPMQYLARLGSPYSEVAFDQGSQVAIDWGVYGAPETFLISADGVVLVKHVGALTREDWQHKFVPLLKRSSPPGEKS